MKGFLIGTIALVALQVLVTTNGPDVAGGLLGWANDGIRRLADPNTPGLPRRKTSTTAPAPSATKPAGTAA